VKRRVLLAATAAVAPFLIAGCALPAGAPATFDAKSGGRWAGRLSLRVNSEPPQSFAALFELRGAPGRGELTLTSPIGSTLGVLSWAPGEALLRDGQRTQRFDSIGALAERVTGAALPVDALFQWLAGQAAEVPGWRADLHQVADGRLQAVRDAPAPTAELRLIFEAVQADPPVSPATSATP
jgi:outer membrane lipoprotein LolB